MVENTKPQSKHIYIFENTLFPIVKIGMSDNPAKRLTTIESASGFPLKLAYESTPVIRPGIVEALIHKKLKEYRQKGEWFTLSVAEAIKEIELIISDSIQGEYKDLTEPFRLTKECVQVNNFKISNYAVTMGGIEGYKYAEEEDFIYRDTSYNYYLLFKQGDLIRTVEFCNLGLAKKFKKENLSRLIRME